MQLSHFLTLSHKGIFDIAKPMKLNSLKLTQNIPLTIICDNVRDPGNMGSVIRCAAAVGCRMLITTSGNICLYLQILANFICV